MKPHKHAEVLRAIADGALLSEFEVRCARTGSGWMTFEFADFTTHPHFWEVRRKPQYIMVNGFKVPKPLSETPIKGQQIFLVSPLSLDWALPVEWIDSNMDRERLKRGLIHANEEAAIAHAKAMLEIDPEAQ